MVQLYCRAELCPLLTRLWALHKVTLTFKTSTQWVMWKEVSRGKNSIRTCRLHFLLIHFTMIEHFVKLSPPEQILYPHITKVIFWALSLFGSEGKRSCIFHSYMTEIHQQVWRRQRHVDWRPRRRQKEGRTESFCCYLLSFYCSFWSSVMVLAHARVQMHVYVFYFVLLTSLYDICFKVHLQSPRKCELM